MRKIIFWDLDGTLTDSKPGIVRCLQYALEHSGHAVPTAEELLWCIGPPIHQSFATLVPSADTAGVAALVEKYRERFAVKGLFENDVYAGIPELLARVGIKKQYVTTSKPQVFAKQIISHFKLAPHFINVYGSELDGVRSDKGELIRFVLEREGIAADDALIVGDRKHDVLGAKKAGILSVGITWGYGSREELSAAGADFIFSDTQTLGTFLLS